MRVKTNQGTYSIYLPYNLYKKLQNLPEESDIEKTFLALLLNFIIHNMLNDDTDRSGWVNLYSGILRKYEFNKNGIRYRYIRHLNYLIEHSVIVSKTYSTFQKKSKSYKIIEDFINPGKPPQEVILDIQLARLIKKHKEKRKGLTRDKNPEITIWHDDQNFKVDIPAALKYIGKKHSNDTDKLLARQKSILEFKNIFYSRDTRDDRLHSNYTNMASDLRKFISYSGERMVSFDVKSSQPFMLTCILEVILHGYEIVKCKHEVINVSLFSSYLHEKLSKFCTSNFSNSILIDKTIELNKNYKEIDIKHIVDTIVTIMYQKHNIDCFIKNIRAFINLVRTGDLYTYIGNNLYKSGLIDKNSKGFSIMLYDKAANKQTLQVFESLRDCGKTITFNTLYSGANSTNKSIKAYKELFQEVFEFVDAIKKGVTKENPKGDSLFPILLQRMEAKFILDYCIKRIAKKYPNMPLITIHDSIATTEGYGSLLKIEFEKCMHDYFGIDVELAPELW